MTEYDIDYLIELYVGGSCSHGKGSWCTILRCYQGDEENAIGHRTLSGRPTSHSTIYQMKLLAVTKGLAALKGRCRVNIITDCRPIADAINQKWINKWTKNGWRSSNRGGPIANQELWKKIDRQMKTHRVDFFFERIDSNEDIYLPMAKAQSRRIL